MKQQFNFDYLSKENQKTNLKRYIQIIPPSPSPSPTESKRKIKYAILLNVLTLI